MSESTGRPEPELTVLLAEDNDDHALLIKMALERATTRPINFHRARNGEEAVEAIREIQPDLMLLDLKMPGKTGHEVLEVIKADDKLRRIPVAVLTSSDRDEDVARSYGLGTNHFITKPENPVELEKRLRSLIEHLGELKGIHRGAGVIRATGTSAETPATLVRRQVITWLAVIAILLLLFAYAAFAG